MSTRDVNDPYTMNPRTVTQTAPNSNRTNTPIVMNDYAPIMIYDPDTVTPAYGC